MNAKERLLLLTLAGVVRRLAPKGEDREEIDAALKELLATEPYASLPVAHEAKEALG
jgi:hypothetical protein